MNAVNIAVISFDIADKVIGRDRLKWLIRRGVIKYARAASSTQPAYVLLDSLPRRYQHEVCRLVHLNSL